MRRTNAGIEDVEAEEEWFARLEEVEEECESEAAPADERMELEDDDDDETDDDDAAAAAAAVLGPWALLFSSSVYFELDFRADREYGEVTLL